MLVLAQTISETDPWYGLYSVGWGLEPVVFFVALGLTLLSAYRFFPFSAHPMWALTPNPGLGIVRASVLFAFVWFVGVLIWGAASDIVGYYTWLYVLFAAATLFVGGFWRPILDLYYPADVVERGNLAAGLVYGGFALGTAFAFGGALTGEGPGWWVVLVFFLLAYFELRGNMALVSRLSGRLKDDVRLERDVSAGLLLGAVALASGLVSGAAAAGDFLGWGHGLRDYGGKIWPLLLVASAAAGIGLYTRHSDAKLRLRAIGSSVLVALALAYYVYVMATL